MFLDHGCCFGYPCFTRLSTFFAILDANKNYDVYLTGTPPNQLRFRILNADSSFKVRLSMYYYISQRIDLYLNGTYKSPTNAYFASPSNAMVLKNVTNNTAAYMPTYANASGTNLFFNKQMYFAMNGVDLIDLQIAPVLFLSFGVPAITADAFFEPATLVKNFALLLGIDASKIRTVKIVRENSTTTIVQGSRRRRAVSGDQITISLTIYENAITLINDSVSLNATMTRQAELGASVVNKFATGQLQAEAAVLFNGTVSLDSMVIRQPQASPNASVVEIGKITKLKLIQEASACNAQVPCLVQPILQVVDENVNMTLLNDLKYHHLIEL